ncbi:hypothetical protein [Dubosiella newyorkensis]|uniref:hypothetical protein n=1 Tax=Dubosiella newyorkensis TaxID=1862672 RepID=UPI003F666CF4
MMSGPGGRRKEGSAQKRTRIRHLQPEAGEEKDGDRKKWSRTRQAGSAPARPKSEYGESAKYTAVLYRIGRRQSGERERIPAEINEEAIAKDMELAGYRYACHIGNRNGKKRIYKVYHQALGE